MLRTTHLAGGVRLMRLSFRRALSATATAVPASIKDFVNDAAALCKPDNVVVCTGSEAEFDSLMAGLLKSNTVVRLNESKRPNSYLAYTDPKDVARAEADTFICSTSKADCGPTNNWRDPDTKRGQMHGLFKGCMQGRTMYVIPFSMGPLSSPYSKLGVEITDSAYVAASMRIMTRMGDKAMKLIEQAKPEDIVRCMHSVGRPVTDALSPAAKALATAAWPCNIAERNIVQFPETREIWSFGSGYGGNSLLGKKCFALRIASVQARDEGWLAEHMLIVGLTNPEGKKKYFCAAFPSACGKTNLAMLKSALPGWKVETVGDDIAWMRFGEDGRLWAINPENGFFGVAPGTSEATNPNAMGTITKNSLYTNVGLTEDGDVYWEGMSKAGPPAGTMLTNWKRQQHWKPTLKPTFKADPAYKIDEKSEPCAQANSRFTTPIEQCPCLDSEWDAAQGVPIEAIIFGGRRADTLPLVFEAFNWDHGTFLGSIMRSTATAASDQSGLGNDPMAMKAFCGYNVKDYFAHWIKMGQTGGDKMPKIFHINWFRTNSKGSFMWPGFGDNVRVMEWMFNRIDGTANAVETPIGMLPGKNDLNVDGLDVTSTDMTELLHVDVKKWQAEAKAAEHYFTKTLQTADCSKPVPAALMDQLKQLKQRLGM